VLVLIIIAVVKSGGANRLCISLIPFPPYLSSHRFLGYIEFVEQIGSGPDALDVRVTGEWMLEPRTHPFTGQPCTAIRAELETITYGPSSNKANDWPSLGPIRLLDVLYLDDDLQITRVNVNTDSIFVYQRQRA
jgi:hypothetical protein